MPLLHSGRRISPDPSTDSQATSPMSMFTMTKFQPPSGILHRIEWHGTSPYGVPFAVVTILDAKNERHRALACSRRFGDLSRLEEFEGLSVNLVATPNGLQLKPIADQISPERQLKEDGMLCVEQGIGVGLDDIGDQIYVIGTTVDVANSAPEGLPINKLQKIAATVARLASELRFPACIWIHIS